MTPTPPVCSYTTPWRLVCIIPLTETPIRGWMIWMNLSTKLLKIFKGRQQSGEDTQEKPVSKSKKTLSFEERADLMKKARFKKRESFEEMLLGSVMFDRNRGSSHYESWVEFLKSLPPEELLESSYLRRSDGSSALRVRLLGPFNHTDVLETRGYDKPVYSELGEGFRTSGFIRWVGLSERDEGGVLGVTELEDNIHTLCSELQALYSNLTPIAKKLAEIMSKIKRVTDEILPSGKDIFHRFDMVDQKARHDNRLILEFKTPDQISALFPEGDIGQKLIEVKILSKFDEVYELRDEYNHLCGLIKERETEVERLVGQWVSCWFALTTDL